MPYTIASFSGGKDSTAMVLRMLEIGEPLDEVMYCDTGMEFPAMVEHIKKVSKYVRMYGVKFTVLKGKGSFEYYLLGINRNSKRYGPVNGYGWPDIFSRWCTDVLKKKPIDAHIKELKGMGYDDIVQCVGLAYDEMKRAGRENNLKHRHPLIEWGWTEKMCLEYCYEKGFDWYDQSVGKGLYEIFDRTSCWICPLANLDNLRKLRKWYPDLWNRIGELEAEYVENSKERIAMYGIVKHDNFKARYSWRELEERFAKEDSDVSRIARFL